MLMDFTHGILFFVIGCTSTLIGFFIAFLVINYNQKKQKQKEEEKKNRPHSYYGDDTV